MFPSATRERDTEGGAASSLNVEVSSTSSTSSSSSSCSSSDSEAHAMNLKQNEENQRIERVLHTDTADMANGLQMEADEQLKQDDCNYFDGASPLQSRDELHHSSSLPAALQLTASASTVSSSDFGSIDRKETRLRGFAVNLSASRHIESGLDEPVIIGDQLTSGQFGLETRPDDLLFEIHNAEHSRNNTQQSIQPLQNLLEETEAEAQNENEPEAQNQQPSAIAVPLEASVSPPNVPPANRNPADSPDIERSLIASPIRDPMLRVAIADERWSAGPPLTFLTCVNMFSYCLACIPWVQCPCAKATQKESNTTSFSTPAGAHETSIGSKGSRSDTSTTSINDDRCRICLSGGQHKPLCILPCKCKGVDS